MPSADDWFVYVLRCKGDRLYCGVARDVAARFAEHVNGSGAKFTRAFMPLTVVVARRFCSRSTALREEFAFKTLRRAAKERRITEWMACREDSEAASSSPR